MSLFDNSDGDFDDGGFLDDLFDGDVDIDLVNDIVDEILEDLNSDDIVDEILEACTMAIDQDDDDQSKSLMNRLSSKSIESTAVVGQVSYDAGKEPEVAPATFDGTESPNQTGPTPAELVAFNDAIIAVLSIPRQDDQGESQDTGNEPVGTLVETDSIEEDFPMSTSNSETNRSVLSGNKYSIAMSIMTAVLVLEAIGIVKPVHTALVATGIQKQIGDGSDGFMALTEYIECQAVWQAAQETYKNVKVTDKDNDFALMEAIDQYKAAKAAFTTAQKHFLTEMSARTKPLSDAEKMVILTTVSNLAVPQCTKGEIASWTTFSNPKTAANKEEKKAEPVSTNSTSPALPEDKASQVENIAKK